MSLDPLVRMAQALLGPEEGRIGGPGTVKKTADVVLSDAGLARASFEALPPFAPSVRFPNGARIERLRFGCPGCGENAPPGEVRGRCYHPVGDDYRTVDTTWLVFDVRAWCTGCRMFFSCLYRVRDDFTMVGEDSSGVVRAWPAVYRWPAWVRALRRWCRGLLSRWRWSGRGGAR